MSATDASAWAGKQTAFTGRLASMTRSEAADLVRAYGGVFSAAVSRRTHLLVVGQEGWPLQKDGSLTNKLQRARRLQKGGADIAILPEEEFLHALGLQERSSGVHRLYTTAQLCRILHVPRDRIRAWVRAGFIKPIESVHGVSYFDFQQVTGTRTLCELVQAGVTAQRMRRSLEQLRQWLPNLDQPLDQLMLIERDGDLLFRLNDGQLVEPTGQLQFDFAPIEVPDAPAAVAFNRPPQADGVVRSADEWWELGCRQEESGQLAEAAEAFRQVLFLRGPDADACFNLANVLYALGKKDQAAERYRQAVELDHDFAAAWNNLGNVLGDQGEREQAIDAYRRALALDATYADAHYNLADTLTDMGRRHEARPHWQAYLNTEPLGQWADYARRQFAELLEV